MSYVDGFLLPVPKRKLKAYAAMSKKAGKIWREHGALQYNECVGDDMKVKGLASFLKAANVKAGETVIFAFIVFKSKAHRNAVNKKVMADKRLHDICKPENSPFDVKRMNYGGFKVIVDA